jgi:hypothetical protein
VSFALRCLRANSVASRCVQRVGHAFPVFILILYSSVFEEPFGRLPDPL